MPWGFMAKVVMIDVLVGNGMRWNDENKSCQRRPARSYICAVVNPDV
jgi:hypothetical protein